MNRGKVREWHTVDGWGVIESNDTPGGCWTHFSSISGHGFLELAVGDSVQFDWEPTTNKDGFRYVATHVEAG